MRCANPPDRPSSHARAPTSRTSWCRGGCRSSSAHPFARREALQTVERKVGVVTGAASGIGLGIARAFAGAGMRVVLSDNRPDALAAAVNDLQAQGHE